MHCRLCTACALQVLTADWCKYNECMIATGSVDKSIKVWDVRQPQRELAVLLRSPDLSCQDLSLRTLAVRELMGVTNGDSPWLLESSDQMSLIRRLEE